MNEYSLLKGRPIRMNLTKIHWWSRTPHFMFNLQINEQNYEVVVNVYSKIAPEI